MPEQLALDWRLDEKERGILVILNRRAYQRLGPVPMEELAAAVEIGTRELQEIIQRLVTEHGYPICSSSRRGANGYWIALDAEDIATGRANLMGRIRHLLNRLRALDAAAAREFTRQLALEMGGNGEAPERAPGPRGDGP